MLSNRYSGLFIIVLLLSILCTDAVFCQSSRQHKIHGVVIDSDTGEPIPTVHVYISQTTIGTTTQYDGTFQFSTNLSGVHILVFSYVGYKTQTQKLNFYAETNPYFEIKLTPDPIELDPLEVTASNKEWQQNFKIFRQHFIGTTSAARKTEIENSWVINFERDSQGNLIANTDQPLVVVNRALGYQLQIDLVEFKWPNTNEPGYYLFYSSYRELESENERGKRKWERNRLNSYRGSFEHFLKSLYDDNLRQNNFEVVLSGTDKAVKIPRLDSLSTAGLRLVSGIPGMDISQAKAYQLRLPVDVLYGKRRFNRHRPRSRIVPMDRSGIFLVTKQARLANPVSLRLDGVWSNDRVANLLPVDYSLDE